MKKRNTLSFREDLEQRLKNDPELRKEWNRLQPEKSILSVLIDARTKLGMTQKELSAVTGIDQSDISKIERGKANPTLAMLLKLADGLDMDLNITFTPRKKDHLG